MPVNLLVNSLDSAKDVMSFEVALGAPMKTL